MDKDPIPLAVPDEFLISLTREQLESRIKTDPVVGIDSRIYFDIYAPVLIERARKSGHPVAAIMIDIDNLRDMNTFLGHPQVNLILKEMGRVLASCIRKENKHRQDRIARFGGDEILVLLPDTDRKGASVVAKRMVDSIRALADNPEATSLFTKPGLSAISLRPSISAGAADIDPAKNSLDDLIKMTDKTVYESKKTKDTNLTYRPQGFSPGK